MSVPLIDLRTKIDELTDAVLDVEQQKTGTDRSEIVRLILHEWSASKVRDATLLCNSLIGKGLIKEGKGSAGQ